MQMPGRRSGVEVARELAGSPTRVLVLSASGGPADVLEAVKAGGSGQTMMKSAGAAALVDAVRRTAAGDAVFTPRLAGLVGGVPMYRRRGHRAAARRPRDRQGVGKVAILGVSRRDAPVRV